MSIIFSILESTHIGKVSSTTATPTFATSNIVWDEIFSGFYECFLVLVVDPIVIATILLLIVSVFVIIISKIVKIVDSAEASVDLLRVQGVMSDREVEEGRALDTGLTDSHFGTGDAQELGELRQM